ncbi:MAG: hypothetical protein LBS92_00740 [Candidatus Methanoplasma sp.]|nr:hypothetical protein [Candidatus Methanoplasma sp.]
MDMIRTHPLAAVLVLGMIVRCVVAPLLSFSYDLSFWVATSQGMEGGRDIYETSYFWYTPLWGYILGILTWIGNVAGLAVPGIIVPELVTDAVQTSIPGMTVTSIGANLLYKAPLFVIDTVTALIVHQTVVHLTADKRKAAIAAALWYLCPLVIWSSAVACMFDSLSAMFALIGFYFTIKERYLPAGIALSVAVSAKVFPICLVLVILAYVLSKHKDDVTSALKHIGTFVGGALLAAFAIYFPVMLSGNLYKSFEFFYARSESVSGPFNPVSMIVNLSYNSVIQLAPILIVALILIGIKMYKSDPADRDRNLILASVLSFAVIFLWPPTPTYPVVMVPFLAMAICVCGEKLLVRSWVLFSVLMTAEALIIFNTQLFYSLAAFTDLLDLGSLISATQANSGLFGAMEHICRYTGFIPAISVFVIAWRHNWLGRLRLLEWWRRAADA